MSEHPRARPASPRPALLVLLLALAATGFGFWQAWELVRSEQRIRWQEGLGQFSPLMQALVGQRFETLHDQAKTAFRRDGFTTTGWTNFLAAAEWRQRIPGVVDLGYAEYADGHFTVRYVVSQTGPAPWMAGRPLDQAPVVRAALQETADKGYGIGSREFARGTNRVVMGLLSIPFQDKFPSPSPATNRANLAGVVFLTLDQPALFASLRSQLKNLPFTLQLLSENEPAPLRTATRRVFSSTGDTGQWRFVATMGATPVTSAFGPWGVLVVGLFLSGLFSWWFYRQACLRRVAEVAREEVLAREAEITRFNHELEQTIRTRTAELHQALAEERELNRLKSNFIAMVNHEIRTPLALILGSAEILARYLDRLSPEKRTEHLQTITQSVDRMSGLLEDVLLFSKAEAGRMEFRPEPMDLREFCSQLADEMRSATHRRCPIVLTVAEIGPARADKTLLRHILSNLITNAVKYSPAGTPVEVSVRSEAGEAIITVTDQGVGIPEADQKRLFSPFFRGKNVATLPGTGLGLVIVKHCTEQHGGQLQLTSVEGRGTTVTIRLPLFSPAHTEFIQRLSPNPSCP